MLFQWSPEGQDSGWQSLNSGPSSTTVTVSPGCPVERIGPLWRLWRRIWFPISACWLLQPLAFLAPCVIHHLSQFQSSHGVPLCIFLYLRLLCLSLTENLGLNLRSILRPGWFHIRILGKVYLQNLLNAAFCGIGDWELLGNGGEAKAACQGECSWRLVLAMDLPAVLVLGLRVNKIERLSLQMDTQSMTAVKQIKWRHWLMSDNSFYCPEKLISF